MEGKEMQRREWERRVGEKRVEKEREKEGRVGEKGEEKKKRERKRQRGKPPSLHFWLRQWRQEQRTVDTTACMARHAATYMRLYFSSGTHGDKSTSPSTSAKICDKNDTYTQGTCKMCVLCGRSVL